MRILKGKLLAITVNDKVSIDRILQQSKNILNIA